METTMNKQTHLDWMAAVRLGLLGGVVALLVSLVGMVQTFGAKDVIGGVLSQGHTLLLLVGVGIGYLVSRRLSGQRHEVILAATLAGFIAGVMLTILALVAVPINLRSVLVNASPKLVEILTFGRGQVVGSILWLVLSTFAGGLGGAYSYLPARISRPLLTGIAWTIILGVFQDVLKGVIPQYIGRLFFASSGLSVAGAIIIFAVVTSLSVLWSQKGEGVRQRFAALPPQRRQVLRSGTVGAGLLLMLLVPLVAGTYLTEVVDNVGIYILMGLGLNIVVGFAGLLDLGYVAFFAIGAYTMGIFTSTGGLGIAHMSFWTALPIAVGAAVLGGVVLGVPVLKMRGDYLAIVTMAFGEIIRVLALSDALAPIIGGAQGVLNIPKASILGWRLAGPEELYYLIVAGVLLAIFVSTRLHDSRIGRAWIAIREDEDVAEAMGVALVKHKLLAFASGAAFSGLSGAIFATKLGSVFPHSFNLLVSINVLCLIIVGGMASIPGVIVGALILMGLPELLRTFGEYRYLLYGAMLVVMMLVRPEGFIPATRRRRELHAENNLAEEV
mgnify:CR=1 FL=1